jgi:hypothetical protein
MPAKYKRDAPSIVRARSHEFEDLLWFILAVQVCWRRANIGMRMNRGTRLICL